MKIKPDKDFPDVYLCVTGSHSHEVFRVAPNHGRIYLPEQLVVHAKDYTQQHDICDHQVIDVRQLKCNNLTRYISSQHPGNGALATKKDQDNTNSTQSSSYSLNLPKRSSGSHLISSVPPPQDPSQFAIGSMVYIPTQHGDPLCGEVMWIGTLPEFPGVIAGVELVSHIALIH